MKQKIYTGGNYLKIDFTNDNGVRVHGSQYPSTSTTFNETWFLDAFDDSKFIRDREKTTIEKQKTIDSLNKEFNREMQDLQRLYDETRSARKRAQIKDKMKDVKQNHLENLENVDKQFNEEFKNINEEESKARAENLPYITGFRIVNVDSGGIVDFLKTDIDNGNVIDEKGTAFDISRLQDFLQDNTGGQMNRLR